MMVSLQTGVPASPLSIRGGGYQPGDQVVVGWDPSQVGQSLFGPVNVGAGQRGVQDPLWIYHVASGAGRHGYE
jgi:hypothetical protein